MTTALEKILDLPFDIAPDPDEFIRAAMEWHFNPETGSAFWLKRAKTLDFDPRTDVRTHADLRLFPNVSPELRDVRAEDLIPKGYGKRPDVVGFFESGGTTGIPKRVVLMRDWGDRMVAWSNEHLDRHGVPRGVNWLGIIPSGPHVVSALFHQHAITHGTYGFMIDLDPRWVKKLIADKRFADVDAYAGHIIDQAVDVLRTQDIRLDRLERVIFGSRHLFKRSGVNHGINALHGTFEPVFVADITDEKPDRWKILLRVMLGHLKLL